MAYIIEFTGNGTCGKRDFRGSIGGLMDLLVNLSGAGFTCKWRRA